MKILVIQTAFTGDAILATAVLEELHTALPEASIHLLVRKGNETLFHEHPFIAKLLVWDKRSKKWSDWLRILRSIRTERYDRVVNLQRFASTGLLTVFSGATVKTGFNKNPLSFLFSRVVPHELEQGVHETDRNHRLISDLTDSPVMKPRLYPCNTDLEAIAWLTGKNFVCMAPGSVWFTKMWPEERWCELISRHLTSYPDTRIYLLGAPAEQPLCERIAKASGSSRVENLAGRLSLLQSAALMGKARMNYVNDSAPMHMASAMNAPVTAIYCSTLPTFGFGPLSDHARTIEVRGVLECRPCGLHGKSSCPKGHFKCGLGITADEVIA